MNCINNSKNNTETKFFAQSICFTKSANGGEFISPVNCAVCNEEIETLPHDCKMEMI